MKKLGTLLYVLVFLLLIPACNSVVQERAPNAAAPRAPVRPRKLLVFMDGTANEWDSRTNVRRLFELVAAQEDPGILTYYCEGVGTVGHRLAGTVFGRGMKRRVELCYNFLAQNYQCGDEIYVFGFSRGSLEARTLTGIIAHVGIAGALKQRVFGAPEPEIPFTEIWDYCRGADNNFKAREIKEARDADSVCKANIAALQPRLKGLQLRQADIRFLGVWDTVPGLTFTKFDGDLGVERHEEGANVRYHMAAYPCIHEIAHALSMDEVRSRFSVQRFGQAMDPRRTRLHEVWFPGAHSDIGGGYADSNDLAGISLQWMLNYLKPTGILPGGGYRAWNSAMGIMHHPEMTFENKATSHYERRVLPKGAIVHPAFLERARAGGTHEENAADLVLYRPDVRVKLHDNDASMVAPIWKTQPGTHQKTLDEAAFRQWFRIYDASRD